MENLSDSKEMAVQRYVDIMTNPGFKALFGDMQNKEAVITIINSLLPDHRKVADISYMPTEYQGPVVTENKEYRYDFMCHDASGVAFIVEMQCYHEDHWFKRCVSYASRAYDRQNRKGKGYDVPPVYLIGLMGVDIPHENEELWKDRYVSEYTFREKFSNELQDETIVIIFAEISRFHKKGMDECLTDQDKILYVLKNMGNLKNQPGWLRNEIFTRIFKACEIAGFSMDKRIIYDKEMNDEGKLIGQYSAYRRMGFEQGIKEGRAVGMTEGLAEGHAEGRAEGLAEGRAEGLTEGKAVATASAVRKMSRAGMSVAQISSIMEISEEEVGNMLEE